MSISLLEMNPLNNDNDYNNNNHSSPGQENAIQGVNKDDDRVNISISSKAYNILLEHTQQLNRENAETQRPFTIEEVYCLAMSTINEFNLKDEPKLIL
jgi:hypothetical protein